VEIVDQADTQIAAFLTEIQSISQRLTSVINHYKQLGVEVCPTSGVWPVLTGDGFSFSLWITLSDRRRFELEAALCWNQSEWVIKTEASLEEESKYGWTYPIQRALPVRAAKDWRSAAQQLALAIDDLVMFDDLSKT